MRFSRAVFFAVTLIMVAVVASQFGIVGRNAVALDAQATVAGVDVLSVTADLVVPQMEEAKPVAGKRVRRMRLSMS